MRYLPERAFCTVFPSLVPVLRLHAFLHGRRNQAYPFPPSSLPAALAFSALAAASLEAESFGAGCRISLAFQTRSVCSPAPAESVSIFTLLYLQIAWVSIGLASWRFRKAWVRQGRSLDELKFHAGWTWPWGPPFVVIAVSAIIISR